MKEFGLYMGGLALVLALAVLYVLVLNPLLCTPPGP